MPATSRENEAESSSPVRATATLAPLSSMKEPMIGDNRPAISEESETTSPRSPIEYPSTTMYMGNRAWYRPMDTPLNKLKTDIATKALLAGSAVSARSPSTTLAAAATP